MDHTTSRQSSRELRTVMNRSRKAINKARWEAHHHLHGLADGVSVFEEALQLSEWREGGAETPPASELVRKEIKIRDAEGQVELAVTVGLSTVTTEVEVKYTAALDVSSKTIKILKAEVLGGLEASVPALGVEGLRIEKAPFSNRNFALDHLSPEDFGRLRDGLLDAIPLALRQYADKLDREAYAAAVRSEFYTGARNAVDTLREEFCEVNTENETFPWNIEK